MIYKTALRRLGSVVRPLAAASLACLFAAAPAMAKEEPLKVQLLWHHQAEFAGHYAAEVKDYFKQEEVEVETLEGGPGILPLDVLAEGKADVAQAMFSDALGARHRGIDVVNIAQVYQHSTMALACRKDAGIRNPPDVEGKTIGTWRLGDEVSMQAILSDLGIAADDVTIEDQAPNAGDIISGRHACGTVMMYNEYWSLLASGFSPADLLMIPFDDADYDFLENGYYVLRERLDDPAFVDRLERFLRAAAAGWAYAKKHPEDALAMTLERAPQLDRHHQERMLHTVLGAVGEGPFGLLDLGEYERSVGVLERGQDDPEGFRKAAQVGWTHKVWAGAGLDPVGERPLNRATAYHLTQAVSTQWFYILDLIGTVAFGLAGFMRAQQRRYDLWGAFILTLLPAVAGGTLRDLLVGGDRHPPFIFKDSTYILLVIGVVIVGTAVSYLLPKGAARTKTFSRWLTFFDTIGMATFTVIGAKVALLAGLSWYWAAFCAALTCAGGGMLLDVVTGREPRTFQGEPYEEIAVVGGLFLYAGLMVANNFEHAEWLVTALICATLLLVFTLRMLVVRYGWRSYRLGRVLKRAPAGSG